MTRRYFTAPIPNCGHGGATFTHVVLADTWMCPRCLASIGPLYEVCTSCGGRRPHGELVTAHRKGRICSSCSRDHTAQLRFAT